MGHCGQWLLLFAGFLKPIWDDEAHKHNHQPTSVSSVSLSSCFAGEETMESNPWHQGRASCSQSWYRIFSRNSSEGTVSILSSRLDIDMQAGNHGVPVPSRTPMVQWIPATYGFFNEPGWWLNHHVIIIVPSLKYSSCHRCHFFTTHCYPESSGDGFQLRRISWCVQPAV